LESVLAQVHEEMNAGLTGSRREEQMWDAQRIVTQLKVLSCLFNFSQCEIYLILKVIVNNLKLNKNLPVACINFIFFREN